MVAAQVAHFRGNRRGRGRGSNKAPNGTRRLQKRVRSPSPSWSNAEAEEREQISRSKRANMAQDGHESTTGGSDVSSEQVVRVGQTFAALCSRGLQLGCAFLDSTTGTLHLLEDTQDNKQFDFAKRLLEQLNPSDIILAGSSDERIITVCRVFAESRNGRVSVRAKKEFVAERGRDRLLGLPFLSTIDTVNVPANSRESEHASRTRVDDSYSFMGGRPDVDPETGRWQAAVRAANFVEANDSPLCMGSVGALLDHLVRTRAFGDNVDDVVTNIELIQINSYMSINKDALSSLQIFQEQTHASMHSNKTKEGLSLFGTLNNTKTRYGAALLRQWFLQPSLSPSIITARHDAISVFLRQDNVETCELLRTSLRDVHNVPKMLVKVEQGKGSMREWEALTRFTYHCAVIAEMLEELVAAEDIEVVKKLKANLVGSSFAEMGIDVNNTIDWEESRAQERLCVKRDIDSDLDAMKEVYDGLDDLMTRVSQQIAFEVPPEIIPALNVVYFPQIGFLISVALPDGWARDDPIFNGVADLQFQFNTEATAYFKSSKMHDLDNHIGDIQTNIMSRELEIMHELYERVMPCAPAVEIVCGIIAELDCLLSFAQASLQYNYTRPNLTEENVIVIQGGRHPLHEQIVDCFIPNDAYMVGGMGLGALQDEEEPASKEVHENQGMLDQTGRSMVVVTGANACGKSVYLKQIALIQYMAQIGCFVPAEHATVGLVDRIFTRIHTRESISRAQSAFMIDLNQVSLSLRNATSRSLVLLDEFGKGTVDTDGAGLLVGVLRYLLARGPDCPRVLVTTHFRDVFRDDLVPRSLPIQLAHMRVMLINAQDGTKILPVAKAAESIVYLYQVAPGLALESHAAKCAGACGLSERIVQRAQYVTNLALNHELGRIPEERISREEQVKMRDAEAVFRRFISWHINDDEDDGSSKTVGKGNTRAKLRQILGVLEPPARGEQAEDRIEDEDGVVT